MTPPLTLRPNRLQESVVANESTSTQTFGVMFITLAGLIDSMVPVSRPWAVLGKLLSYIVKLAPILWWALPAGPAGHLPASSQEPPTGWIPDTSSHSEDGQKLATKPATPKLGYWVPNPLSTYTPQHTRVSLNKDKLLDDSLV
ncbi:hypothetical protein DSO57_1004698 [Entomophthora muscae]|uniref:Uncharacterized protein n=1 Tax=Entomophthora muscae TaxID=34485 RepID=A0ACC2SX98_9FUNG|nr:hypothetical protein DSO57_1004698 [Entomophthora muscae]